MAILRIKKGSKILFIEDGLFLKATFWNKGGNLEKHYDEPSLCSVML